MPPTDTPPSVAFIVTGQCRPSPSLLHVNDSALATKAFLTSYSSRVLAAHGADAARSTVFLLLKEGSAGACGPSLCEHVQQQLQLLVLPRQSQQSEQTRQLETATGRMTCIHHTLHDSACREACPTCTVNGAGAPRLREHKCFSQSVLFSWTPAWCTMWQAWRAVVGYERALSRVHGRVVYSRIDLHYDSPMGHWSDYTKPWHSGHVYCHDMFWVFTSRQLAACALGVFAVQVSSRDE